MSTKENGGTPGQGSTAAQKKTLDRPTNDAIDGNTQASVIARPRTPLDFAALGWSLFPVRAGGKEPLTRNGFKDASDDQQVIKAWEARWPTANWATPTGIRTVDVLDVDVRPDGDGRIALERVREAGLLEGSIGTVRTPSGGLHIYFKGTNQSCGRLPKHFIDWKSCGGYILLPGSTVNGRRYEWIERRSSPGGRRLLWDRVRSVLEPARASRAYSPPSNRPVGGITPLVRWVSELTEGNRNSGLYWATCRALDGGHRGELGLLVDAAVRAGLSEHEALRTVSSAERRLAGAA